MQDQRVDRRTEYLVHRLLQSNGNGVAVLGTDWLCLCLFCTLLCMYVKVPTLRN